MKSSLVLMAFLALAACARPPAGAPSSISDLNTELAQARQRVVDIVNRPVQSVPRTGEAAVYSPGWFHPGAIKPDFATVDVRATQEFPYAGYVTSDVTPTEMFLGRDLEFNAMTKYFYTDRTRPKARLTQDDMIEINRLYRVIARDEAALSIRLQNSGLLVLVFLSGVALLLVIWRRRPAAARG
jgi:hypothetical protein